MQASTDYPQAMLQTALETLKGGGAPTVLDDLPAAIYLTDREGVVTYFNRACIGFAGRIPVPGEDRWCVTWKLYTEDGDFLPHDQCPMAVAIRERRPVRGVPALAERPDGTRVSFIPYPTPLFDEAGRFDGAFNMLVDRAHTWALLSSQAARCRRLSRATTDKQTAETLDRLAAEYEQGAVTYRP